MPRAPNVSTQNNFVKGLITEATGLTFPENACTETYNCNFDHIGQVGPRTGFDFEDQYDEFAATLTGNVTVSYLWRNVAGDGSRSFVVVQVGDTLHFYQVTADAALSANKHADTIDLTDFVPTGITTVSTLECQFSFGNGILFVTNPNLDSFYVEYDVAGDTISATEINIQIRDFEGDTTDASAIDARPATNLAGISAAHRYNLLNQGWTTATLTSWDTARADMPSNCDVSWFFKDPDDAFDFATVDDRVVGNTPAPRGHHIFNVYDVDRNSIFSGADSYEIATDRVSLSAFFAGRIFYAGLNVQGHNSKIYFSQIIENSSQYGKCHQVNDPASENFFDLLPSDGGVIDLQEAGEIIKMIPVLNALVVFATEGIWAITGSQGASFTANDYAVNKISAIRNISYRSFVDVEGIPYWWNFSGISTITLDPQTNAFRVVSVTDQTIKTFYDDILLESKENARGVYDSFNKRIQWIYRSEASSSFNSKYEYDRVLNFNILTSAFYPWSVDISNVKINSIVSITGVSGTFELSDVFDGANDVVDGANDVVAFLASNTGITAIIKYLVSYDNSGNQITFADLNPDMGEYLDWETFDATGTEYESYLVTGYALRGDAIRKFQTNYVNIFSSEKDMGGEEHDHSFLIRGQWNFSTTGDSGKWSTAQVITPITGDFDYKPNRIKIRGHGLACQFRISNNGTDPFHIVGWSVFETVNRWV